MNKFNELNWSVKYEILKQFETLSAYKTGLPYHTEKQKLKVNKLINLISEIRMYITG